MNQVVEQQESNGAPGLTQGKASRRWRAWLGIVLFAYLVVTLAYGIVNPVFEAPDEHMHYFTVQYIVDNGRLPTVLPGDAYDEWMGQEAAQPPLYYLLGSLVAAPLNPENPSEILWPNEFTTMGDASSLNNINRFVHKARESFPWDNYVLAVHLLRGLSTVIGLGTLLFIYGSGRLLWPIDPYRALLGTALVAFLPQFNFLHASVTNDVLIIFLASATLWQIIRIWQDRATSGRLLLLGVTTGLAALTKNAGIVLIIYALCILILMAVRGAKAGDGDNSPTDFGRVEGQLGGWRLIVSAVIFTLIPALLIAGWLWLRNWLFYGDFTAANQFVRIAGGDRAYSFLQVIGESSGLWLSLFAVFGWFNLRAPDWVYWFWTGTVLLSIAGGIGASADYYRNRRRENRRPSGRRSLTERLRHLLQQRWVLPLLLAGWVLLVYASLVRFMLETEAAQGRLLFPALVPLALGVAYGLTSLQSIRRISPILPPIAFMITLYCLFFVIRPAYALPPAVAKLPEMASRLDAELGQGLTLVGAEIETQRAEPGDQVWMTLYWQAQEAVEIAPEFAVTVYGRDLQEIAKLHSYHGRGMYPANTWETGEIIADRFYVLLEDEVKAPVMGRIRVNIVDGDQDIQAGEVKIIPTGWPQYDEQTLAQIGEAIRVESVALDPAVAKPGETIQVDIRWEVLRAPNAELTTLVHLGQPDQAPLAVGDRPPLNGDYPTKAWEAGEAIDDVYFVTLPEDIGVGRYPLWIGMYDSETITRWPLTINGEAQPYDVFLAGWVDVSN